MFWSDKQIMTLIRLVNEEKLFANEIAKLMKVSKGAIIGKVHRLAETGIQIRLAASPLIVRALRKAQPRPRGKAKENGVARKKKTSEVKPGRELVVGPEPAPLVPVIRWVPPKKWVPPKPSAGQVTVLSREPWMCKWPVGRVEGQTLFCGKVRFGWSQGSTDETASPYCEHHRQGAYQATKPPAKPRPRPHFAK